MRKFNRQGAAAVGYHDSVFAPLMALFLMLVITFAFATMFQHKTTMHAAAITTTGTPTTMVAGDPHGIRHCQPIDCAVGRQVSKELGPIHVATKKLLAPSREHPVLAYGSDNGIGTCSHWIKRSDIHAARQACPGCHGHTVPIDCAKASKELAPATARLDDEEGRWNDNIQLASTQPVESWKFKAPDVCLAMVTESGLTRTRLVEQLAFKYGTARHKRGLAVNDRRLWIARQFGIQLACVRLGAEQNTVKAIDEPAAPSRALPTIVGLTV